MLEVTCLRDRIHGSIALIFPLIRRGLDKHNIHNDLHTFAKLIFARKLSEAVSLFYFNNVTHETLCSRNTNDCIVADNDSIPDRVNFLVNIYPEFSLKIRNKYREI